MFGTHGSKNRGSTCEFPVASTVMEFASGFDLLQVIPANWLWPCYAFETDRVKVALLTYIGYATRDFGRFRTEEKC